MEPVLHADYRELYTEKDLRENLMVNPTGKFEIGGPMGDAGLTGRKIIVDTYGGAARHGGGAFSGKDPSKVDRSAAYAARYVAKNVVAAELADRCEVQVAYAIGVAHPLSLMVETYGTERVPPSKIIELVQKHFDLRPGAIVRDLDLRRPIFRKTAAYGHFGRDDHDFSWEKTDKAEALKRDAGVGKKAEPVSSLRDPRLICPWHAERTAAVRERPYGLRRVLDCESRAADHGPRPARAVRLPDPEQHGRHRRRLGAGGAVRAAAGAGPGGRPGRRERGAARAARRAGRARSSPASRTSWSSSACGSRTPTAPRRRAAWRWCCLPGRARARERRRAPRRASCSRRA